MDSTDISSQIGALELGDHLASHGDSVLEATMAGPALTTAMCPRIDDGVLEAAGANTALAVSVPTSQFCSNHRW
jgi:hypothetical protein